VGQMLYAANDGAASGGGIFKSGCHIVQVFKGFVDLDMKAGEVRWGLVMGYGCVGWVIWNQNGVGSLEKALLGASKVRRVVIKGVGER